MPSLTFPNKYFIKLLVFINKVKKVFSSKAIQFSVGALCNPRIQAEKFDDDGTCMYNVHGPAFSRIVATCLAFTQMQGGRQVCFDGGSQSAGVEVA